MTIRRPSPRTLWTVVVETAVFTATMAVLAFGLLVVLPIALEPAPARPLAAVEREVLR